MLGLLLGKATHWLKVTGVVGYLFTGIALGPEGLGLLELTKYEIELITWFALGFIGFTIGGKLSLALLKRSGKKILWIMAGGMIVPFVLVMVGVYLFKGSVSIALIFGALACTSAPAGTIAVIYEYRARGSLTDAIIAVVGLDDAFGVVIFGVTLAGVSSFLGGNEDILSLETLWMPIKEVGGALLLGGILGLAQAFIVKKIHERVELFALTLALLLAGIGIAMWMEFSVILATITIGMVFVNILPHESRVVFQDFDGIALPIFIVFFVTAGMELELNVLLTSGLLLLIYVLSRTVGKISGPMITAKAAGASKKIQNYVGLGILPQAGVALGLALMASNKLKELGQDDMAALVITTITATTVIFEIIGPLGTRFALVSSGEATRK